MTLAPEEIRALSVDAVVAAVNAGTLSASAVAEAFLAVIDAREDAVGAFETIDRAAVRAAAAAVGGGPLAGITLGVKDVIETADLPTGYGSTVYAGARPLWDAPVVTIARSLGAVVMGKTVSTEFAMSGPGRTRNPWNPGHTPGGSSSGSAAAVGTGMLHAALGTQTSGSILRPAAYCGAVGYKPSFGTLVRVGVKALSDSLDTVGMIARTVADAGAVTAALAEAPKLAAAALDRPPRIGIFRSSRWDLAEPATREALARAAAAAEAAGASVVEVAVPDWFEELYRCHDAVMGWETPRALAHERAVFADRIAPPTRAFLDTLARTTRADYDAALARIADRAGILDALIGDCDVLFTPAATGEAPAGLGATGDPVFCKVWTLLHGPALAVPAGFGPNGLPVAVQVVGRLGRDAETLAAAAFAEAALKDATS
ncbi:amidase [Oharaeibacter diazotrophicus]|uniref:Asp-tRNA(Asn)/Glu-tRNA(Gln) amidotransferase A subunit family amidase n=1 Tax=Oharaeibacter diazotrophicus TaxID=1920512 RepID=A0A4R6R7Q8_9HYPH|nr:amidase [Oharaeibacter diazotrophicus]TDP81922.1 Asp-tRNA(Asn)/Glu-tRNA(Gln) amidotransferase A subunit family amidase [Oharaeibacter diazotrophicus]BBE73554.1 glutamyl-tRNA(Gln) amidotransferase subunit A [Pleomorphomonas sp. SM30]GLS75344.1 amidase [Oharaeibacter diazotrophicus]